MACPIVRGRCAVDGLLDAPTIAVEGEARRHAGLCDADQPIGGVPGIGSRAGAARDCIQIAAPVVVVGRAAALADQNDRLGSGTSGVGQL